MISEPDPFSNTALQSQDYGYFIFVEWMLLFLFRSTLWLYHVVAAVTLCDYSVLLSHGREL